MGGGDRGAAGAALADITLKPLFLQAKKGLQVGYATVGLEQVKIEAADGKNLVMGPEGKVTGQ